MTARQRTVGLLELAGAKRVAGLIVLVLAVPLVLAACRGRSPSAASDIQMNLAVAPNPPAVGQAEVTVRLADSSGAPITGAAVEIEGDMTHAGMVPVRAKAQPVGDGRYVVPDFRFTMAGDWVLTVNARLPDGRTVSRTFDVNGVTGDGMPTDMGTPPSSTQPMRMPTPQGHGHGRVAR